MILSHQIFRNESSKEWVTFVHGAGGSSSIWYKQIREFKLHYNLLLIDLRGHGKSANIKLEEIEYNFENISRDVLVVLNHLNIKKSHFVGISLGSMIISYIAMHWPKRVQSMILGGTILKMNFTSNTLLFLGNALKKITPYIFLYKIFAGIILPKKNHAKSRKIFINEARKLNQKEFLKWFGLSKQLPKLFKKLHEHKFEIPTLFIQGEQDHLFLFEVKKYVNNRKHNILKVIKNCGHVVNIEADKQFNTYSLHFLRNFSNNELQ